MHLDSDELTSCDDAHATTELHSLILVLLMLILIQARVTQAKT